MAWSAFGVVPFSRHEVCDWWRLFGQSECRACPGKRSCSDAPLLRSGACTSPHVLLYSCSWISSFCLMVLGCRNPTLRRSDAPLRSTPVNCWNPALRCSDPPSNLLHSIVRQLFRSDAPMLRSAPLRSPPLRCSAPLRCANLCSDAPLHLVRQLFRSDAPMLHALRSAAQPSAPMLRCAILCGSDPPRRSAAQPSAPMLRCSTPLRSSCVDILRSDAPMLGRNCSAYLFCAAAQQRTGASATYNNSAAPQQRTVATATKQQRSGAAAQQRTGASEA